MSEYQVSVFTGNVAYANTFNNVYIKLVGKDGESQRTWLTGAGWFLVGLVSTILLAILTELYVSIDLETKCVSISEDAWFVDKVKVTCPEGKVYTFPMYHWINDGEVYHFREGTDADNMKQLKYFDKFCSNTSVFLNATAVKKGNIFLCDYKILDGVKTSVINGEMQYLAAPLVLLHKTPDDSLKPVAIQVRDQGAPGTLHRGIKSHLIHGEGLGHFTSHLCPISSQGPSPCFPPLYDANLPFTSSYRCGLTRTLFLLFQNTASGGEGMRTILKRSLSTLTYSSLCMPEDITERGVESVPNYYYRDDGLRLWDIIHRFVKGVIHHYYKTDQEVQEDSELQEYIKDIFEHGIPQSFSTVDEVVKFVTVVIFTSSAQHSAVNTGQLDIGVWMPNFPPSLQLAPPTIKGRANEHTLLQTLPDYASCRMFQYLCILFSQVALGKYSQELFTEDVFCKLTKDFENELKDLDEAIDSRNKNLKLPYTYLEPKSVENSVSL
uniref:Lipoxygenase domain-containing protein n=1 Tax=Periophthalmus magnuspinnatus TaxID=409849 RepID=A0A3B3ZWA2_9GOBI